jgi:carboxyl-terminal processing protease
MTQPRKLVSRSLAAIIIAASLPAAFASPASDLYRQATGYLQANYGGFSTAALPALASKYEAELATVCAPQGENCPAEAAHPILDKLVEEISDNHTAFLTPKENKEEQDRRAGVAPNSPRIGLSHGVIEGSSDRLVLNVRSDGPAAAAGIQRGDRIVSLNGQPTSVHGEKFPEALIEAVSSGKPVTFTIQRGARRFDVTLTGRVFTSTELPSISYRPDGFAVLRIPDFEAQLKVGPRVHDLVAEAKAKGAKGIVLDLRGNPGGNVLDVVVAMGAFLPNATVTMTGPRDFSAYSFHDGTLWDVDRNGRERRAGRLSNSALWTGPVAALVNANSYSGSEYLSAAIQHFRRGKVYGEVTGGLGNSASQTFSLVDGSAIQITVSRSSYTLGGDPYPERVTPDVEVKDDLEELGRSGRDTVLERAIQDLASSASQ